MKNKVALILFLVTLVVVVGTVAVGMSMECSYYEGQTPVSNMGCYDFLEKKIQPTLVTFVPLLVVSIILLFVRRETFVAWVKFAVPAFVIMFGIIFYTYNNEPAIGGWVNWGSDDQLATLLLPSLFFLISLIIIIRSSLKLRKA